MSRPHGVLGFGVAVLILVVSIEARAGVDPDHLGRVATRVLSAEAKAQSTAIANEGSSATSEADAKSKGGRVEVISRAVGEASSELKSEINSAVAEAVAEVKGGGDADATATAVAEEIGRATARAIAKASVKINVEGAGIGSGGAEASSRAIAKITVTSIAEAFASATGSSEASSKARAEVSETDVAEAAANAVARAESTDGFAEASQTTVATAVAEVIARAVASALATVKGGKSVAETDAEAEANKGPGQATVETKSKAKSPGGTSCRILMGIDLPSESTINNGSEDITGSDAECCSLCDSRSDCNAWTRITRDTEWNQEGECWMRNSVPGKVNKDFTNSGVKSGGGSASAFGDGDAFTSGP
ncbi:hypothetical protein BSKO_05592 [Bryopsis sp. KO-2023]|nr:hypothetical protein BSKO_05592 [Bryopsis sp. KO-2023]